jgi:hypothetical protein
MGKRSAVVELFLGDMGSIQRETRPSTQREDQLTMETKLEQIALKAVNQLPKSVVREIRTPRSVGAGGGRPPPATRWDGKRSAAEWPKLPRPSSTLPQETCDRRLLIAVLIHRPIPRPPARWAFGAIAKLRQTFFILAFLLCEVAALLDGQRSLYRCCGSARYEHRRRLRPPLFPSVPL